MMGKAQHHDPKVQRAVEPQMVVQLLAIYVVEIMLQRRPVENIAMWVSNRTYEQILARRTLLSNRAHTARIPDASPRVARVLIHVQSAGTLECTALVVLAKRVRAITMQLEPIGTSWRATTLELL